jgi:flagellar hook-basal body complex protein FliE
LRDATERRDQTKQDLHAKIPFKILKFADQKMSSKVMTTKFSNLNSKKNLHEIGFSEQVDQAIGDSNNKLSDGERKTTEFL